MVILAGQIHVYVGIKEIPLLQYKKTPLQRGVKATSIRYDNKRTPVAFDDDEHWSLSEVDMPKGIPQTEDGLNRRRRAILDAVANLIIEKGFHETSMREIGIAAAIGKSTLYDYFPSKDDILIAYVADEIHYLTTRAEEIMALRISAPEKIRRIMHKQLEYMAANKPMYMRLTIEIQRLGFDSQQRIQEHRHAYQDMLCHLVEEGIRNGEFRPVNPLLAIRGMFAFISSAAFTTRPTGSLEEMMNDAIDIIFKGLEAR
jgi:AcrR family transcriptional regulator